MNPGLPPLSLHGPLGYSAKGPMPSRLPQVGLLNPNVHQAHWPVFLSMQACPHPFLRWGSLSQSLEPSTFLLLVRWGHALVAFWLQLRNALSNRRFQPLGLRACAGSLRQGNNPCSQPRLVPGVFYSTLVRV